MFHSCFLKKGNFFLLFLLITVLIVPNATAQEINATVTIDRSQISSTSLGYLDELPDKIESYLNEYSWIDATFNPHERVRMDMQITLLNVDHNYNFEAQLIVRSYRPIYQSLQETVVFFFNDEYWQFNYTPNRGLVHDDLQFDSFTSVLDFYAYMVLGYDFDSFEEFGGTPFFNEAQNLVSLAQSASTTGWSRTGNQTNRAQLIADLLNPTYQPFRSALYGYHRQGLDQFLQDPRQGREQILQALKKIREVKRNASNNLLFDTFFNAKYRELPAIFEDAEIPMRLEAFDILSDVDPGHLTEYRKLQ